MILNLNAPPLLNLDAVAENDVISRTAGLLDGASEISNFQGFLDAVLDRQRINPPILGNLAALPHARTPFVKEIVFVASRCDAPVPFGPELKPVRLVFLFGVPPHRISEYLAVTAALVRRLREPAVIDGLLAAPTAEEFADLLQ